VGKNKILYPKTPYLTMTIKNYHFLILLMHSKNYLAASLVTVRLPLFLCQSLPGFFYLGNMERSVSSYLLLGY
jgi:hypothetical protein